jgi:hypothetical protein
MASWLRGRVLALLTLGHRGPRVAAATCVAATSGLVSQHSQYSTCDGSYPPLTGSLRCASVRARFLRAAAFAAFVLIRHLLFGASSVGVNW